MFFSAHISGQQARGFAKAITAKADIDRIEIYPLQSRLVDGPGSLIRAPFGYHRKVHIAGRPGKRYHFRALDTGAPLAPTIRDQIAILTSEAACIAQPLALELSSQVRAAQDTDEPLPTPAFTALAPTSNELPLSERIKGSISVLDFVSHYVQLDSHQRGFCPFHDDEHQSFGVNTERNYWHCYAH
jgi:hypothetical protein